MEFVLIQPGVFVMGLVRPPQDLRPAPPHEVTLGESFYMARHEVTQDEWRSVMGTEPSHFSDCGASCPVESVSWLDVNVFLVRFSEQNPGETFRLPTEAEWEYACRAGSGDRYGGVVDTLHATAANYDGRIPFDGRVADNFEGRPTRVGTYPPNPWGLYDFAGNVWEWVADEYCPYPTGAVANPAQSCGTDTIPIRGGSWYFSAGAARCGRRYTHHREDSGFSLGFRVVRKDRATVGTT
jgi:formylglycine-generating enzyme required for sulfatase activity